MSKENSSVAPKERINIKYVPATGGQQAEVELPLNLFVAGDFKGKTEDTAIEDREIISIDKNNFSSVMNKAGINLSFNVPNHLVNDENEEINVNLEIGSLVDFSPDQVAKKVPELKKLLDLREALVALKGPLGNIPAFRSRLQSLLSSEESREELLKELELFKNK